jgi:hypothetical protein
VGFVFVDSSEAFRDDTALVVRIPPCVRSKQKLLAILADKLRFPHYFGWNWDALEECLRDLSWLPKGQPVTLVHAALPFGPGGENRRIYLGVLRDVVAHWQAQKDRPVRAVFPADAQTAVALHSAQS